MTTLKATPRDGSINNKQLRRNGYTPAIVYGKNLDASISVQVDTALAVRLLKSNAIGSQIELAVGDDTYNTMLKDIANNPTTYKLEHLDFQVLTTGEKVSVQAHLNLLNKDQLPADGVLQELVSELNYTALPKDLIDHIDVDLSNLEIGDAIHLQDLAIASDDRYSFSDDLTIELVHLSHMKKATLEEDEEEDLSPVAGSADVPVIGKEEE